MKGIFLKKAVRTGAALFAVVLAVTGTAGCSGRKKSEKESSFSDDSVVMQTGGINVRKDEVMAYAYLMAHKYSMLGGEIWSYDTGKGRTTGQEAVQDIADTVACVKVINREASKEKVTLNADETDEVQQKTTDYLRSISKKDKEKYMLGRQKIQHIFEENAIAEKMYYMNIGDAQAVSDEEAREADFEYILLPDEKKTEELLGISPEEIYEKAKEPGNFGETAAKYTTAASWSVTFGKDSSFPADITDAAMKLKKGEISELLEDKKAGRYYIFYCTETTDRDATEKKKEALTEENQKEAFRKHYDEWLKKTDITMNESFWNSLDLSDF